MSLFQRMMKEIEEEMALVEKISIPRALTLTSGLDSPIVVKQFDHNSRRLDLTLKKDMITTLDLSNSEIYLVMKKSNGASLTLKGEITNAIGGKVNFLFTKESLDTNGNVKCEIVRKGNDGTTLSFPFFDIQVNESMYEDSMLNIEDDEFTIIDNIVPMREEM